MARKDSKKEERALRSKNIEINKIADQISTSINSLYQSTYYNTSQNKNDIEDIKAGLDNSFNNLSTSLKKKFGYNNISNIISRISDSGTDQVDIKLAELFEDGTQINNVMLGFMEESTSILEYDKRIDLILKYMPKLKEALNIKRDNVICADNFNKDYLLVNKPSISGNDEAFLANTELLKRTYDLIRLGNDLLEDTQKRGEQFLYLVPADKAISRLLKSRDDKTTNGGKKNISYSMKESVIYTNGVVVETIHDQYKEGPFENIDVEFCCNGLLEDAVCEKHDEIQTKPILEAMSLTSSSNEVFHESLNLLESCELLSEEVADISNKPNYNLPKSIGSKNFEYPDGLIDPGKLNDDYKNVKINGSIIRVLERHKVKPIYKSDQCYGYLYIEYDDNMRVDRSANPLSLTGQSSFGNMGNYNNMMKGKFDKNKYLDNITDNIVSKLDSKFINDNQDLKDEIYSLLKASSETNATNIRFKITYIPPNDIIHIYFKKDKLTHRGVSDLADSLLPASLYSALYITNSIWSLTRAQDKRVYYINQSVDTNIASTLMNTVNQIMKGNMNIRQFRNINNVLNITGQFNDYIIPKSSSGTPPVEMELLPGQKIDYNEVLMKDLEEMAINPIEVPIETLSMSINNELATRLTMSSAKFLRTCYTRQGQYEPFLKEIFTRLYSNEFGEDLDIEVRLPQPIFLNVTNTNQMITNVKQYALDVSDIYTKPGDTDEVKAEIIKNINIDALGSYLDINKLESICNRARHTAALKTKNSEE